MILNKILVCLLIVLGLFLRFYRLDAVPAAFYHDEMDHVVTGATLIRYGTDLSGTWTPWQLKPLRTYNITAELPAVFHAMIQLIFGSSPGAARSTNAIFGLLTVLLTGLLATRLSGKREVGYWVGLVMLLNPWHIHISRLGYESTISLFFQVLLFYGFITTKLWLSLPAMFFGYYTYHGAKFTIIALTLTYLFWWSIKSKWRDKKIILIYLGAILILVSHSLWSNKIGSLGNRSSTDMFSLEKFSQVVNDSRRDRIPFVTDKLVINKYIVGLNELYKRYLFTFDTYRLFVTGYEGGYQFSLLVFSYFGLAELIGLGLFISRERKHKYFLLLLILLIISPIATVMAGYQALLRSALTYTLLIVMAGWGLSGLKKPINFMVMSLMLVTSVWFGLQYFSRYPLLTAENHMLSERILARYIKTMDKPITIVMDSSPYNTARSLVFYNQWYRQLTHQERQQFEWPFTSTITLGQVSVTTECPTELTSTPLVLAPSKWQTCGLKEMYQNLADKDKVLTGLPSPLDNGSYYLLWRNYLCGDKTAKAFIHLTSLDDFVVEKMTDKQFCETWIKSE